MPHVSPAQKELLQSVSSATNEELPLSVEEVAERTDRPIELLEDVIDKMQDDMIKQDQNGNFTDLTQRGQRVLDT